MTLDWKTNPTGIFWLLGKIFGAQVVLETAVNTTVAVQVTELLETLSDQQTAVTADLEIENALSALAASTLAWQQSAMGLSRLLAQLAQQYLIESVHDDNPQPDKSLVTALIELERQMLDANQTLDETGTITDAVATVVASGDGVVVTDTKWADGETLQLQYAENLEIECTNDSSFGREQFFIKGELAAPGGVLAHDWPKGSGHSGSLTARSPADSILRNSGWDKDTKESDVPDDWVVTVGAFPADIGLTSYEIQNVVIGSNPTTGNFWLTFTSPITGDVQTTTAIAWNASGGAVQTALRKLVGLGAVTVITTGTAPNLTHQITFVGVAGNVAVITAIVGTSMDGTVVPGAASDGTAQAYSGRALMWNGDGSTLIEIVQQIALEPLTWYAWNLFGIQDTAPAAGVMRIRLVDSVGGTTINDKKGTANSSTIDLTSGGPFSTGSSWAAVNGVFRTPNEVPPVVYFELKTTTAITNNRIITLDHLCLVKMQETYEGGPPVAIFSGRNRFAKEDRYCISPVNARDGTMLTRMERNFSLAVNLGKQLPTTSGTPTILDNLIT